MPHTPIELISIKAQVKSLRQQEVVVTQNFHWEIEEVFEHLIKTNQATTTAIEDPKNYLGWTIQLKKPLKA